MTPETGIVGGVLIRKRFLCSTCQVRILDASIEEPFYNQMKEGLKELWLAPVRGMLPVTKMLFTHQKPNNNDKQY
jgi:deoxycytidylate deaminase